MKMNTDPNKPLIDPPAYKNFLKQKPKELQSWQIDKCAQEQEEKQGLDFADKIINKFKPKELECELNKEQKDWLLDVLNTKSDNALKVILINGLISKLITQQRTELLERVNSDVIGKDMTWGGYDGEEISNDPVAYKVNEIKDKQRQSLNKLKEEVEK